MQVKVRQGLTMHLYDFYTLSDNQPGIHWLEIHDRISTTRVVDWHQNFYQFIRLKKTPASIFFSLFHSQEPSNPATHLRTRPPCPPSRETPESPFKK